MSDELKITKERVLSAAEKCSTAKETLKELFPEAFEEELFCFGNKDQINLLEDAPFIIGKGLAPDGLKYKCLVVLSSYEIEVIDSLGYKCLIFRKKP